MKIEFPNLVPPKLTVIGTVSFPAIVDGEYLWCEISCEALRHHFGASSMRGHDLLLAFYRNSEEIHQAVRDYLQINEAGPVVLITANFR